MHSLYISLGGFTTLGTVKQLYLVLAMPVRTRYLFVLTLYITCRIHGLGYCKAALFSISYVRKDWISLHSLCISFKGFTALRTVKRLYLVLAIPVRTGYLFTLTLYIIWRIHSLRHCKVASFSISYVHKDRISLYTHFVYYLKNSHP